ncbi:NAD(P)/FAD-dependent oxidoreductase [Ruixingdingia sedimenti]|uniref:FAD-binding oxidoreductase n=1 Tax=Ruixingdingia sedimenti TaxID=3073604 RepID=A0ABU1F9Z1_9RHOB|nr:FAD-binding oxidoreductase [Xinfangfangia sp. LG-4]MDR5653703.1 FAD-binding oxidoreductase [Xinfangfangia sp. LG-4]
MATPDLTVMGAGVFGLSVAWAAARRGARVRVIDPHDPGAGASGGLVGALAPHVPEQWNEKKQFQLESLLMAAGWWAGVAAAGGVDPGHARVGRWQPLADARAVEQARARAAGAAALWRGAADWRVVPAAQGGWAPPAPSGWMVEDTLSARLSPRRGVAALVAAIRARGGEVLADGAAAGPVVWATGAAGLRAMGAGDGVKGQALALRLNAADRPQIYADGLHIVPHADGTVAIGSTSERVYDAPDTVDGQLDALHARAVALLPCLAGAPVVARWAGERPRAKSRAPLLGPWPGRAGHFVANGGFKIGFGVAPKVGEVMADLVLDGRDAIPEGFRTG